MSRFAATLVALTMLGWFGAPSRARAFGIPVHRLIPERALAKVAGVAGTTLDPLPLSAMGEFWRWLRRQALSGLAPAQRERLSQAWPNGDNFSLKRLLSLNPTKRIWGIDRTSDAPDLLSLLSRASAHPDVDKRDQARVDYTEKHSKTRDRYGRDVPDDPATLNMGTLRGLSSQASAHYGLLPGPLSDDADVLKKSPERFAIGRVAGAKKVLTFAPQRAQLYADLALLARLWGRPGARRLAALFTGAAWHYLQDVGNQIHTVQVGLYDFFYRAKLLYWMRAALTLGGYLAQLVPFTSIGLDILSNHHIFIESLGAQALAKARKGGGPLLETYRAMARESAAAPGGSLRGTGYAAALVRSLIRQSAPEGASLYRLAWEVATSKLRAYDFRLRDEEKAPERFIKPGSEAKLRELLGLVGRGLTRVAAATRRWWAHFQKLVPESAGKEQSIAAGLFRRLLAERAAANERRRRYLAAATPPAPPVVKEPVWIAIDLGLLVFVAALGWGIWRLVRRLRRRKRAV